MTDSIKEILLTVENSQSIDGQKDKIELTTVGTIEEKGKFVLINYTEEQEPPVAPVNVMVKIMSDNSMVEITRSGSTKSCLIIERSKRNLCHYGTQFGDILMGIYGRAIDGKANDGEGMFDLCYDIDINGSVTSRNEVKMIFRNNQENI